VLTDQGRTRANWRLPAWFHPDRGPILSCHPKLSRWTRDGATCVLESCDTLQEFVLDIGDGRIAIEWLRGLFREA
jgi:hypothetical protein